MTKKKNEGGGKSRDRRFGPSPLRGKARREYPLEFRLQAVREIEEQDRSQDEVARALGVSKAALGIWLRAYRSGGVKALENPQSVVEAQRKKKRKPKPEVKAQVHRKAVIEMKEAHPQYGTRRIRDLLRRFEAVGVSEQEVRRVLHEAGFLLRAEPQAPRQHPKRRFERAQPNQLWQSDIFTFLLRRHERIYVTVFLDDHSRFVVSHAMAHHQRSTLVLEAFERGVAAYGCPREVLTDQGRQYTAWRGQTEFEQTLKQYGVAHLKSRPQHPQTLGKVERFWKTLWTEFLSRTVFSDFADCQRRFELFIQAYNFQRPHQALDGLVPADRYFQSAPHVREAIERNVADNARRLALEQPPRKPFYLVGRLGDRDLSIAAEGNALKVKLGDDETETIQLEGKDDEIEAPNRIRGLQEETEAAPETAITTDAEVDRVGGDRGNRTASVLDDLVRAEWGEAGDGSDQGRGDHPAALLSARAPRPRRDALGADAGEWSWPQAGHVVPDPRAGGEDPAAREGEAPDGALALDHEEADQTWADEDEEWPAEEEEDFEFIGDDDGPFDPDERWRDDGLTWTPVEITSSMTTENDDGATKKKKKSDYLPEPEVPEEIRDRYTTILEVISGTITVADGARRLNLSRNRFQTLLHRAQAGMISELAPKPSGRPKEKSDEEKTLFDENVRLKKENDRLQLRIESFERLLGVAGDLLRGRATPRGRNSKTSTSTTSSSTDDAEERQKRVNGIGELRRCGLTAVLAAAWPASRRTPPPAGSARCGGAISW
jgi:transposase InsO family protein